jgi:hypothetical protein
VWGRERERYREGVNEPYELLFGLLAGVEGVMSLMSGSQFNSWGVHQKRSEDQLPLPVSASGKNLILALDVRCHLHPPVGLMVMVV